MCVLSLLLGYYQIYTLNQLLYACEIFLQCSQELYRLQIFLTAIQSLNASGILPYFPHCLHLVCKNSSCQYIFSKSQNKFVANKNWFTVYVTVLIMMQGKTEKLSHFLHRANVNFETNNFYRIHFLLKKEYQLFSSLYLQLFRENAISLQ